MHATLGEDSPGTTGGRDNAGPACNSCGSSSSRDTFEAAYRAHAQAALERKPRVRKKVDPYNPYVREAMSIRDQERIRLREGFSWHGGLFSGIGYYADAFVLTGLPSQDEDAHVLRRIVAATSRARRPSKADIDAGLSHRGLCAGMEKGFMPPVKSKLLGLDSAYIMLNGVMRRGWRIDLDEDFNSSDVLWDELEKLVDAGKLPCLPHAIVSWKHPRFGSIHHPHLWWLLPHDAAVWDDPSDPRCNPKQIALLKRVIAGCCAALVHLGADPSACLLFDKGKNLSVRSGTLK